MISNIVRLGIFGGLGASTGYVLYSCSNNELNSFGAVRFGRAAIAAVTIAADYKWNLFRNSYDSPEYEHVLSQIHFRSANRLKEVFCKNGGAFIKVGQHIGSLDYLVPAEYVQTMKELHNKAPESDIKQLFETIEIDLKRKPEDLFREIDSKPIGTASLAQCHRAVLHDGTVVAVKIQHPQVKKNSKVDISTMTFLVNCLARIFPEFRFVWLAEETEKNLPVELDFINEAQNIEKVAKILEKYKFVKVPKVYWEFCSDRILTMEYCEGHKVDDLVKMKENNIDVNKVSKRLGMIYSEMIFLKGFVHCDPHPGNVLIKPIESKSLFKKYNDFEIVLLDHGLYQSLTKTFRYNYANIWMAILEKDIKRLEELTRNFNVKEYFGLFACIVTGRSWDAINEGIEKVAFSKSESQEIKNEASRYLREISMVLNLIPREMLLLLKTNDLLRGIESSLKTRHSSSSFIHMTKCCVELINSFEREEFKQSNHKTLNILKFNLNSYFRQFFYLLKIYSLELFLYLSSINFQ